jgi:hypothetical protein
MPTVAESLWLEKRERIEQCCKDFIEAKPLSIDDSIDVLRARLFGLGLRGQDLDITVRKANTDKFERKQQRIASQGKALDYPTQIVMRVTGD